MLFKAKEKKRLKYIRDQWGKGIDKFRNFELISIYHKIKTSRNNDNAVDESTWTNLNMDDIFTIFDRNITSAGQQYLYHCLKHYNKQANQLNSLFDLYNLFRKDHALRESLQLALMEMRNDHSYYLPSLILESNYQRKKYDFLLYILSFLSIASLVLIPFYYYFVFSAIFFAILNIIINRIFGDDIYKHFNELTALNNLFNTVILLSKIKTSVSIPQLAVISKNIFAAKKIKKKIGWLIINRSQFNELAAFAIEYLNQFCLYDLIVYMSSFNSIKKYKEEISGLFDAAASIDAMISIASLIESEKDVCSPSFDEKDIILEEICHPLLKDPVPNSIHLTSKSALITGSNMAGKTTFIKTAGINTILAQTLGLAFAKKFQIPFMDVYASIKIEDNLSEGKSYFFTEIEEVLSFISKSKNQEKHLFLIDEIFRGTNTVERVSASTAVLKFLNKNNFVLVTTHDIELEELLCDKYEMYNFSEKIKDDNIYFDYKIQKGPCSTRNAIKLLQIKGYPEEIIDEANILALKLWKQ